MKIQWCLTLIALAVLNAAPQARGGSVVIPAWSYARGNVQIDADPSQLADAGAVVVSGPKQPWGWTVEYDADIPVDGEYTLHIRYAATEARPVEVFFDSTNRTKSCIGVTFGLASSKDAGKLSAASSAARWETVSTKSGPVILKTTKGVKTIKLVRRGPLPNLVALRLDTNEALN